jgi:hypothetical protein
VSAIRKYFDAVRPGRNGSTADEFPEAQRGDAWEVPKPCKPPASPTDAPAVEFPIVSSLELVKTFPERRAAVIEGLLRRGEIMNIIAAPKVGKSFLTLGLAFAVAEGRVWLGTFETVQGNVLIIDNELHPETSAHRLRILAQAMGVPEEVLEDVDIVNLRGQLQNLASIGVALKAIPKGRYALIIIDAFYRTLPAGMNENDNATMADIYNQLDSYADMTGAAFALIHHASKGDQSARAVTDVGAGAGAQSRATDTHLILRPHEENHVVVLDAAARSWPPVAPRCLRWDFPLWKLDLDLDPSKLRTNRPRRAKPESEDKTEKPKEPPWTAKRFVETFGKPEPQPRITIVEAAQMCGLSDHKIGDLLRGAKDSGLLHNWRLEGKVLLATVPQPAPDLPPVEESPGQEPESTQVEPSPTKKKRPRKALPKVRRRARAHPPVPPRGA